MGKGMKAGKKAKNRAFGSGGGRGANAQKDQMKKLALMQAELEGKQKAVEEEEFETSVGGDAVKIKVNGKKEVLGLEIEDDLLNPEDKDMLIDLIIAGTNEAIRKAEEKLNNEIGGITDGLSLPGM